MVETGPILNRDALLDHGLRGPRELALTVAEAGLAACDPAAAVHRLVHLAGDELIVDDRVHALRPGGRIVVLGSGKASLRIGIALEQILGERLSGGAIVVRHGNDAEALERIELLEASHPIPDDRSMGAARNLLGQARELTSADMLIACFTGGSSALTSLPPAGVSDADKRELHRLLLGSGMAIGDVNTVRKQVSDFKGGRLALAAAPARVINLTVSDVAGDVLDTLTDPSVQNESTVADAIALLRDNSLWERIPESVRHHLNDSNPGPVDLAGVEVSSTLLVTGATACDAMLRAAEAAGAAAIVVSTSLQGEAATVGPMLAERAVEGLERAESPARASVLVGCGGESTVRLGPGDGFGLGGPNQEAALAAAAQLEGHPVAAAFLDTDGSDGGTDLAGAVTDGRTAARAREEGIDLAIAIASHSCGTAVATLGDGIETGPTHTNVNDLFVLSVGEAGPG